MSSFQVHLSELSRCSRQLSQALALYREAVAQAKAAGDQLSAQWKGAARDAFVEEQKKAYRWHTYLEQAALKLLDQVGNAIREYAATEEKVKRLID